jgi:hypothetical protein
MQVRSHKCDSPGCENVHKPSNGWYMLQKRGRFFVIGQWVEQMDLSEYEHYCSVSCLFKRISILTGKEI